jgi:glycosyltransferase involved in cell wall biosynthesis
MSSIRIGTITFDWYPFDPAVRRLAEAAVEAGHTVDVLCLRQPQEKRYEVCSGVNIYRMPMKREFAHSHSLPMTLVSWCWFLLLAGTTITWLHLKHAYDVIHVHNMPDFLVFSALLPRLLGAKVILEVQDVSPELMRAKAKGRLKGIVSRLASWQERISTTFADHVITVGWPFEELLLRRGVPPEKLTIILNSADPKFFPRSSKHLPPSEHSSEVRPFILMYHGTVAERNGLDTALRALALARRTVPQLRLDIQGRGEYLPTLKQLAADLGLSDHIVFTDPSPFEKIVDFIAHGDVGIIPYRRDGFADLVLPTKAYEYAWMHCPIIASDTRAIRSMFRPESIKLCDPSKPEDFAEAIIDLYQHPEKRKSMVANADVDYKPYRWEVMAKRYEQLLTTLCGKQEQEEQYPALSNRA